MGNGKNEKMEEVLNNEKIGKMLKKSFIGNIGEKWENKGEIGKIRKKRGNWEIEIKWKSRGNFGESREITHGESE